MVIFIDWIVFIFLEQKIGLNLMKKYAKTKICGIPMSSQKDNILIEFNQYMKSDKMSYIIYGHHKFLIKKKYGCENNPEKSSKIKISKHIQCQLFEILIV